MKPAKSSDSEPQTVTSAQPLVYVTVQILPGATQTTGMYFLRTVAECRRQIGRVVSRRNAALCQKKNSYKSYHFVTK